jgi:hypothetical protein
MNFTVNIQKEIQLFKEIRGSLQALFKADFQQF